MTRNILQALKEANDLLNAQETTVAGNVKAADLLDKAVKLLLSNYGLFADFDKSWAEHQHQKG